jgi:hypothetical protein
MSDKWRKVGIEWDHYGIDGFDIDPGNLLSTYGRGAESDTDELVRILNKYESELAALRSAAEAVLAADMYVDDAPQYIEAKEALRRALESDSAESEGA